MLEIKICGLRREADIEAANRLLPDYVGFVFAPGARQVAPSRAAELRSGLDGRVKPVGVFVNAPAVEVARTARLCGLRAVQLHGEEGADEVRALRALLPEGCEVWRAARVRRAEDIRAAARTGADRLVLDAYSAGANGGTGLRFDWGLLRALPPGAPFFLAGGLTPENAAQAARAALRADSGGGSGLDVSSGVETGGFKDAAKIERFLRAAKEA